MIGKKKQHTSTMHVMYSTPSNGESPASRPQPPLSKYEAECPVCLEPLQVDDTKYFRTGYGVLGGQGL